MASVGEDNLGYRRMELVGGGDGAGQSLYQQRALPTRTCDRVQDRICQRSTVLYLVQAQDNNASTIEDLLASSTEYILVRVSTWNRMSSNLLTRTRAVFST